MGRSKDDLVQLTAVAGEGQVLELYFFEVETGCGHLLFGHRFQVGPEVTEGLRAPILSLLIGHVGDVDPGGPKVLAAVVRRRPSESTEDRGEGRDDDLLVLGVFGVSGYMGRSGAAKSKEHVILHRVSSGADQAPAVV